MVSTEATEVQERNKAALRAIFEDAFNTRRLEIADEFVAADVKLHTPVRPGVEGLKPGIEGFHEMIRWIVFGWPTGRAAVQEMIAEGDLVAARFIFTGNHGGWLHGNPPTGRDASWNEMFFARFHDGKVVEFWHELNVFGILEQIGVLPPLWEMGRIPTPLLRFMKFRKRVQRPFQRGEHRIDAWRKAPLVPPAAK